jgi:hypothetical protein
LALSAFVFFFSNRILLFFFPGWSGSQFSYLHLPCSWGHRNTPSAKLTGWNGAPPPNFPLSNLDPCALYLPSYWDYKCDPGSCQIFTNFWKFNFILRINSSWKISVHKPQIFPLCL